MPEQKSALASIGIMGPMVGLAVYLLNRWIPGLGLEQREVDDIIKQAGPVVIALVAIYGRYTATRQVALKLPKRKGKAK